MKKSSLVILLIFLLFITASISACYRFNAFGAILIFILLAVIMYILSPYLMKLEEKMSLYATQSGSSGNSNIPTIGKVEDKSSKELVIQKGVISIELWLGKSIYSYAEGYYEGQLPVLTAQLRNKLIRTHGFELPPVGLRNSTTLGDNEYKIHIQGREVFRGVINFSNLTDPNTPMQDIILNLENCVLNSLNN